MRRSSVDVSALPAKGTIRSVAQQPELSRELRGRIDDAVLGLPDTLRAAFVLRDIEGLSTAEAASVLGITETALKVRLHRARLALREALAPYVGVGPRVRTGDSEEREG